VSDVLFRDGAALRHALHQEIGSVEQGDRLFNWLYPRIKETLHEDKNTTTRVAEEAVKQVGDVVMEYTPGRILVNTGTVIQRNDINILFAEYKESLGSRTKTERFVRFVSSCSVFFLTLVIMISLVFRTERRRPHTLSAFFYLMLGMIVTVAAAQWMQWSAFTGANWEILPLVLFVMLIAIIYSWELATILSIFLTIVIVCGNGGSVELFVILFGTSVVTAVQLGRLRTRGKLVIVSIVTGFAAFLLTIALGIQGNRVLGAPLYTDAAINFVWTILAGVLMTGILPFVEKQFGILTDMRLLELGDVSHPLIQELTKVAPATYGHCALVGAIAEAAADTINARGLLTRVGAYFHDIGKIMKPEYFSENQGGINNVHNTLEPQLSTIVLVAHVKDGVNMAQQHNLPKPLIDLIEQHHGTSLVSFFYGRAKEKEGGKEGVAESTFRYPGPKPQTKEAAILMIADTCESACRSMGVGVPPNKVEAKIRALVKQKLDDGQFDDSGLTLNELKTVEKSVVNSIVASMHGRIQYPEGPEKQAQHRDIEPPSGIHRAECLSD
jgi:putative nucleotidyltransferase with HDIG domain